MFIWSRHDMDTLFVPKYFDITCVLARYIDEEADLLLPMLIAA